MTEQASYGFNKEIQSALQEKLKSYTRKGPGGSYDYFKGEDVVKQLNKAFGHCWSSEVIQAQEVHGQVLIQASVWAFSDGDTVVHHGFGSAQIAVNNATKKVLDIGNAYKSAYTGAIKKAAEQFGIGLGEGSPAAPTSRPSSPSTSNAPSSSGPSGFKAPAPAPQNQAPSAAKSTSRPSIKPAGGLKPRYSAPAPAPTNVAESKAPVDNSAIDKLGYSVGEDEMSAPVTDVQKGAIERLASRKSIPVQKAVADALKDENKNISNLTKAEAALVIRYVNTARTGV